MRTPENQQNDVGVVSEGEEEDELGPRQRQAYRSQDWLSRVPWLTRTGVNGRKRPPVGRTCLILKGNAAQDLGRMCVVSRQTASMVEVVWKDERTGRTHEKMKQPESLIQLEDGLELAQDADGMLWVRRRQDTDERG